VLSIPNTGMAVTIDIGEANRIHPRNKQETGRRLAKRHDTLSLRALRASGVLPGTLRQSWSLE